MVSSYLTDSCDYRVSKAIAGADSLFLICSPMQIKNTTHHNGYRRVVPPP